MITNQFKHSVHFFEEDLRSVRTLGNWSGLLMFPVYLFYIAVKSEQLIKYIYKGLTMWKIPAQDTLYVLEDWALCRGANTRGSGCTDSLRRRYY